MEVGNKMGKVILSKEEKEKLKHFNFLIRMEDAFGNEYSVLGKFKNVGSKLLVRHSKCGFEWEVIPNNLFRGKSKCPKCSGKMQLTTKDYKEKIERITNGEYEILGEYTNAYTKIKTRHVECGYEWDITPENLSSGKRCPRCQCKERYTTKSFSETVYKYTQGEYLILGEYVNNRTEIKMKHDLCDHVFEVTPSSFLNGGKRCPLCNESISKGERAIRSFLCENKIKFKHQYTFEDCEDINTLRFDFGIFDKECELKFLIEFDGAQHFDAVDLFGGKDSLKDLQRRDNIKNKYCVTNNISLIRIPYWESKRLEEILYHYLIEPIENFNGSFLAK